MAGRGHACVGEAGLHGGLVLPVDDDGLRVAEAAPDLASRGGEWRALAEERPEHLGRERLGPLRKGPRRRLIQLGEQFRTTAGHLLKGTPVQLVQRLANRGVQLRQAEVNPEKAALLRGLSGKCLADCDWRVAQPLPPGPVALVPVLEEDAIRVEGVGPVPHVVEVALHVRVPLAVVHEDDASPVRRGHEGGVPVLEEETVVRIAGLDLAIPGKRGGVVDGGSLSALGHVPEPLDVHPEPDDTGLCEPFIPARCR